MKMQRLLVLVVAGSSLLACSCTMLQTPVAVAPVGPGPGSQIAQTSCGFLKVYTDVQWYPYDSSGYYYAHTAYGVYALDGTRVKSVGNAESFHSLNPQLVALSPGQYFVRGWSDAYYLAKVPVEIKAGCLTIVNLEKDSHELFQSANQNNLVHTPEGRTVGWAANVAVAR